MESKHEKWRRMEEIAGRACLGERSGFTRQADMAHAMLSGREHCIIQPKEDHPSNGTFAWISTPTRKPQGWRPMADQQTAQAHSGSELPQTRIL